MKQSPYTTTVHVLRQAAEIADFTQLLHPLLPVHHFYIPRLLGSFI